MNPVTARLVVAQPRAAGQGNLRRSGGGDMADDAVFTAATGQGLVVRGIAFETV